MIPAAKLRRRFICECVFGDNYTTFSQLYYIYVVIPGGNAMCYSKLYVGFADAAPLYESNVLFSAD